MCFGMQQAGRQAGTYSVTVVMVVVLCHVTVLFNLHVHTLV
jgi:hypothetical protein